MTATVKTYPLLAQVHVASPCSADWDAMSGDERVKFCGACSKHVYNLSELTAPEAEALIREREGNFCGRFFVREDGSVLTADCPVGLAAVRARVRRMTYGALALAVSCLLGTLQLFGASRVFSSADRVGALEQLHFRLTMAGRGKGGAIGMPAVAGGICIPVSPPVQVLQPITLDPPAE